jgi:hypothetical protein
MKKLLMGLALAGLTAAETFAAQAEIVQNERRPLPSATAAETPVTPGVGYTPFMLSLVTPAQVPSAAWDVGGLRINLLYGESQNFAGLDISGVAGRTYGRADGIQLALGANIVNGDSTALAIAPVNYVDGSFSGLQIGAVNVASMRANAESAAWQIGVYNHANYLRGFQLGVINHAVDLIGIQIGVINIIEKKDISFLPIINGYF